MTQQLQGRRALVTGSTSNIGRSIGNYGDDDVHGRDVIVRLWKGIFQSFEQVRFEVVHQALNGDVVIAEQIYGARVAGRATRPGDEHGRL
jgi:hypothetical protein